MERAAQLGDSTPAHAMPVTAKLCRQLSMTRWRLFFPHTILSVSLGSLSRSTESFRQKIYANTFRNFHYTHIGDWRGKTPLCECAPAADRCSLAARSLRLRVGCVAGRDERKCGLPSANMYECMRPARQNWISWTLFRPYFHFWAISQQSAPHKKPIFTTLFVSHFIFRIRYDTIYRCTTASWECRTKAPVNRVGGCWIQMRSQVIVVAAYAPSLAVSVSFRVAL